MSRLTKPFLCLVIHSLSHLVNVMRFRMNYTKVVEELNPNKDSKEDTTLWFFLTEGKTHSFMHVTSSEVTVNVVVVLFLYDKLS